MQDLFLTETARRAHVVLPALAYAEKDGTFTNTERCVQVVRQAMQPLPGANADWQILLAVARALGHDWSYATPARDPRGDRADDAALRRGHAPGAGRLGRALAADARRADRRGTLRP